MIIKVLSKIEEDNYTKFLLKDERSLIYYSLKYRDLIKRITESEDIYLIAEKDGDILGVLPIFIKTSTKYGNILNSLPFYGSNGGVLVNKELSAMKQNNVKKSLIEKFYKLEDEYNCISSTIITSPFESDLDFYEKNCQHKYRDFRIGQIADISTIDKNLNEELMKKYHYKTRNMVRKAYKSEIQCYKSGDIKGLKLLHNMHKENMLVLNGIPKPFEMFERLYKEFDCNKDYKIFFAKKDGDVISGLLLLYFNNTVEYFTPVVKQEYRSLQPLSMLIYESMIDAAGQGYKYYNFGGTWKTQDGVYRFKSRWGAESYEYCYFININKDLGFFKNLSKKDLLEEYKYFYVLHFNLLKNQNETFYN